MYTDALSTCSYLSIECAYSQECRRWCRAFCPNVVSSGATLSNTDSGQKSAPLNPNLKLRRLTTRPDIVQPRVHSAESLGAMASTPEPQENLPSTGHTWQVMLGILGEGSAINLYYIPNPKPKPDPSSAETCA